MKKIFLTAFISLSTMATMAQKSCPVIPQPQQSKHLSGAFTLSEQTVIQIQDTSFYGQAKYLQQWMLNMYGVMLPIGRANKTSTIRLERKNGTGKPDAYTLTMLPNQVTIGSASAEGIINGIATWIQLSASGNYQQHQLLIDCWSITDAPLYTWRGLLLDESRFFFGKEKVKSILDWMAIYKLNRFHWHLTDAPGWRLEIKQYPLLTTVGGIGNHHDSKAPATYYTQEDIREIVVYAAQRGITIIPEIDMPGHASASNRAYPEFDGGGTDKYPQFTFNPGKESTYQYLSNILKETRQLFPGGIIHIGGDEVTFGNAGWDSDTGIIRLKAAQQLKTRKEVEDYFVQRMADTVIKLNSKVMAWDEVATASLPPANTIVTWWRQEKPENLKMALDKGYQVVLCPRIPFYLDFVQDSTHKIGRRWNGGYNDLKTVYNFDANQLPVVSQHAGQILGIQACVWTETVQNSKRLDFLLFPRIAAVAETAWTNPSQRNYNDFVVRLKAHLGYYEKEHLYYFDADHPEKHKENGVN
ncbi:beta-hexosaminidase [Chitinophaga silvatica]|uniref:beta-N-acetylhexosaminidase n=1 Tax=Chitinophaga silvatica TaxID=2282649 RepID=A0A3E1YGS6_9BACT|nr:beta-N-acetylhexosaminidase [Chitinophaga silvatica]RFS26564.1 beta-hexosaminidase [Chitinophaga silvatica]